MQSQYDFYFENKNFLRNLSFSKCCFNAEGASGNECSASALCGHSH